MAHEFTDANFKTDVLDSDKLSVIDFWAEWCGPCRAIGPVIEELSKDYAGKVNVGKVNVDNNPQISMNYGITSIPAIHFVKGGQVVDKLVGAQPKANLVPKQLLCCYDISTICDKIELAQLKPLWLKGQLPDNYFPVAFKKINNYLYWLNSIICI